MSQYTVTTTPQGIFPDGLNEVVTITNNGPWTVYLGNDTAVNTSSLPLPALSSIVWDANRPLFAKASGNQSTIVVTRNGNAPVGDAEFHDVIFQGMQTVVEATNTELALFDCRSYNTLIIAPKFSNTGQPSTAEKIWLFVEWLNDAGDVVRGNAYYTHRALANGGPHLLTVPVLSPSCRFVVYFDSGVVTSQTVQTTIYGSTRDLPASLSWTESEFLFDANPRYTPRAQIFPSTGNMVDGADYFHDSTYGHGSVYLNQIGRAVNISLFYTAAITAAGDMGIRDYYTANQRIAEINLPVSPANTLFTKRVIVPLSRPILLACNAPTTATPPHLTIVWED